MNTQTSSAPPSSGLLNRFDSLISATEAFKNVRALALLGLSVLASVLCAAIFAWLGSKAGFWLVGLGSLLAFVVFFYGANAVGIMLMHEAQGQPALGIADSLLLSLYSSHRLIGVAILQFLIVLVAVAAVALILVVCKIPYLGAFLFTFVYPITAVFLGVLVFSLFYVMFPLAGPAVWSGATVLQVIARLQTIATKKLVSVILSQLLLFVIVGFASSVIFLVLGVGLGLTTSVSVPIVGGNGGSMQMAMLAMRMFGGGMGGYYGDDDVAGSGHMIAAGVGGGLLFAAAAVIPLLMLTKGFCLIYLNATGDLDFSKAEGQLEEKMRKAREAAEETRRRMEERAAELNKNRGPVPAGAGSAGPAVAPTVSAPLDVPSPTAPAAPPAAAPAAVAPPVVAAPAPAPVAPVAPTPVAAAPKLCSGCQSPLEEGAAFCGECGKKV